MGRVQAFMPPQGLLLIANYLPQSWPVRFVDENIAPATEADLAWADAVFVTGMHVQADAIRDIGSRARSAGKVSVLGGPSVSSVPEWYSGFDYLHLGEMGDATDALIARLDRDVTPPAVQARFSTDERLPLSDFPVPAYELVKMDRYLIGSLQFSSGCPYVCEFCDIPALYGRQPRLKSPEQLIAELDSMLARKALPASIYFVDDNFIGNRKATRQMLPHLVAWQKKNGYPVNFSCEATLNIAKQEDILAMMREARFDAVFVGIESPELGALHAMHKDQNASLPMLDAIATLNSYGLEVVSGIIIGLDTDTAETEQHLKDFVDVSHIPMLTMNLLQALPKTPLWDRLSREGRLVNDPARESNVAFLRPYDEVVASWRRCIAHAFDPDRLYARFDYQLEHTYRHRLRVPATGALTPANLRRAGVLLFNLIWHIGIRSDYRRPFWRVALKALRMGLIESFFGVGFISRHLIEFTREALRGDQNASFYSARARETLRLSPQAAPPQAGGNVIALREEALKRNNVRTAQAARERSRTSR